MKSYIQKLRNGRRSKERLHQQRLEPCSSSKSIRRSSFFSFSQLSPPHIIFILSLSSSYNTLSTSFKEQTNLSLSLSQNAILSSHLRCFHHRIRRRSPSIGTHPSRFVSRFMFNWNCPMLVSSSRRLEETRSSSSLMLACLDVSLFALLKFYRQVWQWRWKFRRTLGIELYCWSYRFGMSTNPNQRHRESSWKKSFSEWERRSEQFTSFTPVF